MNRGDSDVLITIVVLGRVSQCIEIQLILVRGKVNILGGLLFI